MESIAIIGGGASGLAAAVAAGEAAKRGGRGCSIRVFEAADRVGRPILATGNGRCNFTNARIDAHAYRNAAFAAATLSAFEEAFPKGEHPNGVAAWFSGHGMLQREEGEGRLYPLANKASVVLDVLRHAAGAAGVEFALEARVDAIEPPRRAGGRFTLRMAGGVLERADAVIAACGGKVVRGLLGDGFAFEPQRPVLCPIATDVTYVRELDNIRAKAVVRLLRDGGEVARERGEVLFRKYGISGICTFNLSRLARPGDELSVDFLPFADDAAALARARLDGLRRAYGAPPDCEGFLRGCVLARVADVVLARCGLAAGDAATASRAEMLVRALKDFRAEVRGPGDADHAQVQRGGIDPAGFHAATLEAKDVPGLHVVGEALDVDGPCGGYNLHWAFASGMMAGVHAAG